MQWCRNLESGQVTANLAAMKFKDLDGRRVYFPEDVATRPYQVNNCLSLRSMCFF